MTALRHPVVCLILSGMAFLAADAYASVIGRDERRAPDAVDAELASAVGLVSCTREFEGRRRRSAGTATLVGNRSTLLTAAHVFEDEAGRSGPHVLFDPVADCSFRQFDLSGAVAYEVEILHAAMGEFRHNAGAPNEDWAILRTASPLPRSAAVIPFAAGNAGLNDLDGLPIRMVAFHVDADGFRRTPLVSQGELFRIDYGGFTRLAHTADTGRMSSGAAMIHRTDAGHDVVVGVNRSSANFGDFNLAVPLTRELTEALRSFAHGQVPQRQQRLARKGHSKTATEVAARRTEHSATPPTGRR